MFETVNLLKILIIQRKDHTFTLNHKKCTSVVEPPIALSSRLRALGRKHSDGSAAQGVGTLQVLGGQGAFHKHRGARAISQAASRVRSPKVGEQGGVRRGTYHPPAWPDGGIELEKARVVDSPALLHRYGRAHRRLAPINYREIEIVQSFLEKILVESRACKYIRPQMTEENVLDIKQGRSFDATVFAFTGEWLAIFVIQISQNGCKAALGRRYINQSCCFVDTNTIGRDMILLRKTEFIKAWTHNPISEMTRHTGTDRRTTKTYRVFTGAPSAKDVSQPTSDYHWRTVSSKTPAYGFPPATLGAASLRISLLYQNIIFGESDEHPDDAVDDDIPLSGANRTDIRDFASLPTSDQTTAITWPATTLGGAASQSMLDSKVSFLRPSLGASRLRSQPETQETQGSASYNYSNESSIARFPSFHFNLHAVTSLSALFTEAQQHLARSGPVQKGSRKVMALAAVLEAEGPDTIRVKRGVDAGKEVSLLKLIIGDDDGAICKLTAWREVAESWGGADPDVPTSIKRGDVVLFENVLASWAPGSGVEPEREGAVPVSLSASPNLHSTLQICYRTMPCMPEDSRLRPDLRLGSSDAAVRRVTALVDWVEHTAGLSVK
ncbi:predicted protein [Postia placenta Mad-698-R]|nr:predicted protein [Postia placenta Mad-698-R]